MADTKESEDRWVSIDGKYGSDAKWNGANSRRDGNLMVSIDGSRGEAGGQIVRSALGLSLLTKKPVHIYNIRSSRKNPGLHVQLVQTIKALKEICNAEIKGLELGSGDVFFTPGDISKDFLEVNVPTAASVGLILQMLQLSFLASRHPIDVKINGGATFGRFAPPVPYISNVLLKILEKAGYRIDVHTERHGFYPKGDAKTEIRFFSCSSQKFDLTERGDMKDINIVSIASRHLEKKKVGERQAEAAGKIIERHFSLAPSVDTRYVESTNPGCGIVVWIETTGGQVLGGDSVGEMALPAEKVGEKAAKELLEDWESGACVDRHASDMLIPYMALAPGSSILVPALTSHCKTNIDVVEKFLNVKFHTERKSGAWLIESKAGV